MQYRKILSLSEGGFYIDNINLYNGHPKPPSDTVNKSGDRFANRFFYVVSGTIVFELKNGRILKASNGDIVYLPYGVPYHSWWTDDVKPEFINLLFDMWTPVGEEISLTDEITIIYKDTTNSFYDILYKMHSIYHARTVNWRLLLRSHFYTFLSCLVYEISYSQIENSNFSSEINNGIVYLEKHYMKNISIKKLADNCNVSESTLRRNFIKIKGMSPVEYRNGLRMRNAYDFLKTGLFTVTEVAEMVGFADVPYFSKSFKKEFGITPTDCIALSKRKNE